MQENRSFDSYFGTYPGANGIPAATCVPDPQNGGCVRPLYDANETNNGGPHGFDAAASDVNGGRMDGFVEQGERTCGSNCSPCKTTRGAGCVDVMGYHDARQIPNYWAYAQNFVLQDNMFESAASWSQPEHAYLVSAWSAMCPKQDSNPLDCFSSLSGRQPAGSEFAWTDITYLLHKANVSWRYYIFEGAEPDCQSDEAVQCEPASQGPRTPGIWNPLLQFTDVKEDEQLGNIQSLTNFYTAVHTPNVCGLPNVSWINPNFKVSEHPSDRGVVGGLISDGQAYVSTLINAIMRSPCWASSAIFLSWDDWGGFYDHVVPPRIDQNGYGLRVPGLLISPYAKAGYIDHQQLSHDAYLKFIEDAFLQGARLNPASDGRPDRRPDVREQAAELGDLANEFNFNQAPNPALLLSPHPPPGPPSTPPGGGANPPTIAVGAVRGRTESSAQLKAWVNPNDSQVTTCVFEYGVSASYGASASCAPNPGSGEGSVAVSGAPQGLSPNTTYHFRISASNHGGTAASGDGKFKTLLPGSSSGE